jgi:hypothetical protein
MLTRQVLYHLSHSTSPGNCRFCEVLKYWHFLAAHFMVQVVEHLPSKHEAQSSIPNSIIDNFFVVLGFELRAYTLSHSTSPLL